MPIIRTGALQFAGQTFGGDGRVNFALPDQRGRSDPCRRGHTLGERERRAIHTLSIANADAHASVGAVERSKQHFRPQPPPRARVWKGPQALFADSSRVGGNEWQIYHKHRRKPAHLNMQPFLVLTFCIALQASSRAQTKELNRWPNPM